MLVRSCQRSPRGRGLPGEAWRSLAALTPGSSIGRAGCFKDLPARRWQPLYLISIRGLFCTNTSVNLFFGVGGIWWQ